MSDMNNRLYRKIATRLVKAEKLLAETSLLMNDLDGGLAIDLSSILSDINEVYDVMDERKDRGEYHS